MGTSRSIAVVGLRTQSHAGWRADIASALAVLRDRPYVWLLGMVGFSLRGGIVLLALPIMVLPTQVEVRLALGANLTSTGLTEGFWLIVAGLTLLTLAAMLVILIVLARIETAAFMQLVHDPASSDQRSAIEPLPLGRHGRRDVATRLYVIQSMALLVVLVSAVPLAMGIGDATFREIVAPTSADPIYVRVAAQVREQMLLVVATIFVVELAAATLSRRVLIRATTLTRRGSFARHPARLLAVAVVGWALFIGAVALGAGAIGLAWQVTQSVFLSAGWSGQAEQAVAALGSAILLAGVFTLALLLCGIVSAFRANLWSLASLR